MGGQIDMLDQRPVAAIVYQHGNHFIHLFIWPASRRTFDLNVRSDRSVAGDARVYFSKHQPFISLCLWYAPNCSFISEKESV
jgi:hypothetical protein